MKSILSVAVAGEEMIAADRAGGKAEGILKQNVTVCKFARVCVGGGSVFACVKMCMCVWRTDGLQMKFMQI